MVPTAQDTKPNQQREKARGVKRPQDTKDKLARSLPVESHRMHVIPQQQVVMQRLRWSQLRLLSTQGLYWGLVSRSPLPSTYPIPTSRRKAGARHKLYCVHGQCRHREPSLSVRIEGTPAKGRPCQQGFSRRAVRLVM